MEEKRKNNRIVSRMPVLPSMPVKKRVAAYARVSMEKEAMLHSLAAQVGYYSDLIRKNSEWEYAGVYADEGLTGTKENRPQFQRLLVDCRAGKIDMVLVKSISRFARNTVTLLETVRELKALGIDVYFEEQHIHTISGDGELMLTILASFAQEESRSVSENCKWRIRRQFADGIPTGQTIYGYDVRNGVYTVKDEEAEVVRSIYDMYLTGMGRLKITRALNDKGIPSPDGGVWVPSVVTDILRNEKYAGDLMLQKYYVNNHIEKKTMPNRGELPQYFVQDDHEGIVDRDTFLMVQIEMARRKEKYGRKRIRTVVTTEGLTGKIFCGQCGKGYNRKTTKAGTPYAKPVWICRTFNLKGKAFCASRQIPEDILLPIVQEVYDNGAEVERILVQPGNVLEFILADGNVITRTWKNHSRRESWTPEKREQARQKMMRYHSERRACANE